MSRVKGETPPRFFFPFSAPSFLGAFLIILLRFVLEERVLHKVLLKTESLLLTRL